MARTLQQLKRRFWPLLGLVVTIFVLFYAFTKSSVDIYVKDKHTEVKVGSTGRGSMSALVYYVHTEPDTFITNKGIYETLKRGKQYRAQVIGWSLDHSPRRITRVYPIYSAVKQVEFNH